MRMFLLCLCSGLHSLAPTGARQESPRLQTTPGGSTSGPAASLVVAAVPVSTSAGESSPTAAVLTYAEQMPTFTGGEVALHRYLAANTTYPAEAVRAGLSGTVVMQFVIDEQGRALNPVVVKSSHPAFNAEATRLVWLMPWWPPGRQQGQAVRVRCTLPIVFSFKRAN